MSHISVTKWSPAHSRLLLVASIDPREIGQRIKRARENKHLTQLALALEANVSPSSVTRWESGKLPPVRELIRLAELLEVDADYFVSDEEAAVLERQVAIIDYAEEVLRRLAKGEQVPAQLLDGLAADLEHLAEQARRVAGRLRQAQTA